MRVVQVTGDQFASYHGGFFECLLLFRNDLLPLFPPGMLDVNTDHPPLGCLSYWS